jgi:hypothetical protein
MTRQQAKHFLDGVLEGEVVPERDAARRLQRQWFWIAVDVITLALAGLLAQ